MCYSATGWIKRQLTKGSSYWLWLYSLERIVFGWIINLGSKSRKKGFLAKLVVIGLLSYSCLIVFLAWAHEERREEKCSLCSLLCSSLWLCVNERDQNCSQKCEATLKNTSQLKQYKIWMIFVAKSYNYNRWFDASICCSYSTVFHYVTPVNIKRQKLLRDGLLIWFCK